jgi:hypothetical protein
MLLRDVRIGLRVRRIGGAAALVPDGVASKGATKRERRIGVIITDPVKRPTSTHRTVDVQWEGTDIIETIIIHRLEIAPEP